MNILLYFSFAISDFRKFNQICKLVGVHAILTITLHLDFAPIPHTAPYLQLAEAYIVRPKAKGHQLDS
jgi:hypothetical protein